MAEIYVTPLSFGFCAVISKRPFAVFQLYNDPFDGFIKAEQRLVAAGDGDKHVLAFKLITEL